MNKREVSKFVNTTLYSDSWSERGVFGIRFLDRTKIDFNSDGSITISHERRTIKPKSWDKGFSTIPNGTVTIGKTLVSMIVKNSCAIKRDLSIK